MPTPKHHIWINGFPGVGKLTTAKELHRQIPNSVLIHNHELIDVVTLPRDHPDYISERTMVREETFARWCQPTGPDAEEILDRVLIFTGNHSLHNIILYMQNIFLSLYSKEGT